MDELIICPKLIGERCIIEFMDGNYFIGTLKGMPVDSFITITDYIVGREGSDDVKSLKEVSISIDSIDSIRVID